MKEALYYQKQKSNVKCLLCPHSCIISNNKRGFCGVRENKDGKLYSLVYGKSCSTAVDPIEKKPLFHFMPGHSSFSISTVGCNFRCLHCQNFEISQAKEIFGKDLTPEKIVDMAKGYGCKSISYTYTEPTIFYEYMVDTAKLAKKAGIKNVMVSNGYINEDPLKELCKLIDAANIDLKAMDAGFYKKVCSARLEPVLNSLKILKEKGVWLEITNLIIPTYNDKINKIRELCLWVRDNLGKDVPLHFSRFYPMYKLNDLSPTPEEILLRAKNIAGEAGLNYVYIGNLPTEDGENTHCPKCDGILVERMGFSVVENKIIHGKCNCGESIAGVWGYKKQK
ncbi:MAG: AmmeMemoRadiSam system radical SAM enzyme [Nanoarchaeota archaeon]